MGLEIRSEKSSVLLGRGFDEGLWMLWVAYLLAALSV
jgi:hypothetical protein